MTCPPRFDDGMVDMAELIRAMAESLVNEIMGARADGARGSGSRRNGHRERRLATGAGAVNLRIPRLRAGGCFPEDPIERCSRVDRAAIAAVPEMAADGVSTRKARRAPQAMGMGRMGASQVPGICPSPDGYRRLLGLDAIDTESYTNFRDTTSWPVPCARVDGIYPERSRGGACENVAVMVAIGVNDDRYREALAGAM